MGLPQRKDVSNPVCVSLLAAEKECHHSRGRKDRRMLHSPFLSCSLKHARVSIWIDACPETEIFPAIISVTAHS
jgi:hypothetical protein